MLAVAVGLLALAAGCSGSGGTDAGGGVQAGAAPSGETATEAGVELDRSTDGLQPSPETDPESVPGTGGRYDLPPEMLALIAEQMTGDQGGGDGPDSSTPTTPTTVTATVSSTTSSNTAPTTAAPAQPTTTAGSGGAPVTTTGGTGGGDVSIYQGVLGSLGLDDVVVPAVAAPPAPTAGLLPLTGLPGTVPNRPAAVVKVDNGSAAVPQTGLNSADIVVEEEVEGGITRFAAIFHSTETIVGPVRSGRTTDIGLLSGLGSPLLLYSGANQVTDDLLRALPNVQNRSAARSSGYWRNNSRRAPSNLYSDTAPHWASATGAPPPPQFAYRADGTPVVGTDTASFNVSYRSSRAAWSWDGSAWLRTQRGSAHMTASGQRVSAANVVVIETDEVATGMVDSSGARVPEFVFVGTGRATVFTAGKRIDGVWTKPTLRSVATLTAGDGSVIELTPGRTWIELIAADSGLLSW
jgi:hypothetical protein